MKTYFRTVGSTFLLFCILIIGTIFPAYSQTSNKGVDFWVAYAAHIDGTASRMSLFLSSELNTTYTVESGGVVISSGTITANVVTPVFINPSAVNVYIGSSGTVETNKGIHVTSANPISVYCIISNNARTGGSMILPTKTLGKEYYAFSYANQNVNNNNSNTALSQFTIVAVEDDTEIEITPTAGNASHPVNTTYTINQKLNKGDVYQYQAKGDVSGSLIKTLGSCKPIAVFSGSTFTAFCEPGNSLTNPASGDNLFQQLFPVSSWGKKFAVAPFYNATQGNTDALRIIVSEDNTTINLSGSALISGNPALQNPYQKGSIITLFTQGPGIIEADKPIGVVQYQNTQNCNPANRATPRSFDGDPEMTMLNPIEQTLNDITVFSKLNSVSGVNTNVNSYYLNIIIKTADVSGLRVDGSAVTGFSPIDTEYSYVILNVTNGQDQHRITAPGGFTAIAYGYGNVESYAYLAGADVRNLYQNITVTRPGNQQINSGCVNEAPGIVLRLPYQTASIVWDVDNGQAPYTALNPTPSSTETVDGRTIYIYTYPLAAPVYPIAGKYQLSAIAQNPTPAGCSPDELVQLDFEVFDIPTAKFTVATESCVNTELSFVDESAGNGKNLVSWLWDFGDGNTSTVQNPKHSYLSNGTFTVTLTVQGETGCTATAQTPVKIRSLPLADFSNSQPLCSSTTVVFTDASTSAEGQIVKWIWNPGDGSGDKEYTTSAPFSHSYSAVGQYTVSLRISTEFSCESVLTEKTIVINPLPIVDFTMPEVCLGDALASFTDNSTMPDGSAIQSYLWDFGDNNSIPANRTSTQRNASHRYSQSGYYQVSLTVVSASGCSSTLVKTFTVSGSNPLADFAVQNSAALCSNNEVVFVNKSTVSFGEIGKLEWYFDFGNNASISLTDDAPTPDKEYRFQYPVFYSPATKTVTVKVRAYSGGVCSDEETKTITLLASPKVQFDLLANVCENVAPFSITQARELNGQSGTGVYSGPGISSTGLFNPQAAGIGVHVLEYMFTSANGCQDMMTQQITVMSSSEADAGADSVILEGGKIELSGSATGQNITYKWLPATGLDRDDIANPIASPTEDITYTLIVTTDEGCSTSDEVFIKVLKQPEVPNAFSPNGDGVNDTWNIRYLESYEGAIVQVYSRYGDLVYLSNGYAGAWDGRRNGLDLPVGTYYYTINPGSGRSLISGSVTLLR